MDVNASSVMSGSRRQGEKGTSWAENSKKQLLLTPGFRGAAVVALEMGQELFPSSCRTSPIPHAGITDPLFTCHTCTPKQSDLAERDRGKTKPPEQRERVSGGEEGFTWPCPAGGTAWTCHLSYRMDVKLLGQCCCAEVHMVLIS